MQELDIDPDLPTTIGSDPDNELLNRFASITVCKSPTSEELNQCMILTDDNNRIVLMPIEGHSDCQRDFINACYIDVSRIYATFHPHVYVYNT